MSIFELFMCILCLFWTICHGICHETSWEPGFFGFGFCFPFLIWHLKLRGSLSFGFAARNDSRNKAAWQARQEGLVLVFLGWKEGRGTVSKPNKSAAFLQTCSSGLDYEQRDVFRITTLLWVCKVSHGLQMGRCWRRYTPNIRVFSCAGFGK